MNNLLIRLKLSVRSLLLIRLSEGSFSRGGTGCWLELSA